jgi:NIPSNAP
MRLCEVAPGHSYGYLSGGYLKTNDGLDERSYKTMNRRTLLKALPAAGILPGVAAGVLGEVLVGGRAEAAGGEVYELRVYTTAEGKLDDLLQRFREHTMTIFERHGIKNVGYWTPTDETAPYPKGKTLIYMLRHPSREAAAVNWKAFADDPEWQQVRAKSEEKGKIVEKVESTFMAMTDFSPKVG